MSVGPTTPAAPPAGAPPAGGGAPPAPATGPALQRPEGVSEAEWAALGDPGKTAIVRERQARTTAEQQLAELRRQPPATAHQPQHQPPAPAHQQQPQGGQPGQQPDLASIVSQAVQAAMAPFHERDQQQAADQAAKTIRDAVTTAAADRFHDVNDALVGVDLTQLTNGSGGVDTAKVAAALDAVLAAKPYLGKPVDPRRRLAATTVPVGAGGPPAAQSIEDRTKASLARMQAATGVRFTTPTT